MNMQTDDDTKMNMGSSGNADNAAMSMGSSGSNDGAGMNMGAMGDNPAGAGASTGTGSGKPAGMDMGGMAGMDMTKKSLVTTPQIVAVTVLTVLALAAGALLAGIFGDYSMSASAMSNTGGAGGGTNGNSGGMGNMGGMSGAGSNNQPPPVSSLPPAQMGNGLTQMNGMVLPPGMIMGGMSEEAMRGMSAVDLSKISYTAPPDARGDQPLATTPSSDGVKTYNLDVSLIKWNILPNVQVASYAFNRQVPGPRITITEGDRVRMVVKNNLPEPTSVHWHGLDLPNNMDGVSDVTQKPIAPGATFTYEFTVNQSGTFFYHSHREADRQQALGMYGALIIEPKAKPASISAYDKELVVQLQEWTVKQGYTFPAMPMEGLLPNFFTINGKAYPSTETVKLKVGEKLRVRFVGSSSAFIHPMHIHGGPFQVVATDGNPVPEGAQLLKDTINVGPGERYDVIWTAKQPGKWLLHCHINHHITNDGVEEQGGGGLTMILDVSP